MKQKDHYLKVDKKILTLNKDALSKKALLEYLLHCRRMNPKRNMSCSMAGFKSSKEDLGLNKEAHEKAMKELVNKNLIALRPDVKPGCLKTIAVEVLAFPEYDKETNQFSLDNTREHHHRTYDKSMNQYICIPSSIIDEGYLKELSIQNIYALLWLYSQIDLTNYRGVNFNFIHYFNNETEKGYEYFRNFGDGFLESIYGKDCVEADYPNECKLPDIEFQGCLQLSINELIQKGLMNLVPILIRQDLEDKDIIKIEGEVFKGIVPLGEQEEKYLFLEPEDNIKVIWILRPCFLVKNPALEIFKEIKKANYKYDYHRYNYFDIGTDRKSKIKCLKDEYFVAYLYEWKYSYYEKVEFLLDNLSDENIEEILEILPGYVFRVFKTKYANL